MSDTLTLELRVLLPDIDVSRDACVTRLGELLSAKRGVTEAHVLEPDETEPERVCIHFDPQAVSIGEIREFARRAGATLDERYGHVLLAAGGMHPRKARRVGLELEQIQGVLEAVVAADGTTRIEFERQLTDEPALHRALETALGIGAAVSPLPRPVAPPEEHAHGLLGERAEFIAAVLCGVTLLAGWLGPQVATVPGWASGALLIAAFVFGGVFTVRETIGNLRGGRLEIDFLMLVAAAGAGMLGEWAEGALLLFLFSLGHALEGYAMGRAKRAIEALGAIAPATARVRRAGVEEDVRVENLRLDDVVIVKPNERVPADGFVVAGESSVNQAPITGESVPIDKQAVSDAERAAERPDSVGSESRVFAGTINGSGSLEIQVTRTAGDSTLARVVQMVREAETNRSPTQELTDRFERVFVPAVLVGATLAMFAWVVKDEPFSVSFYRSMALLVASSPCALAIATPSAVLSGVARAARGGVLVKGGSPLENLGRLTAMAFDKTGTLTEGKPRLVDVVPADGVSETESLRAAVAVEALSDHPLAAAVVRDGEERLGNAKLPRASNLRSITGRGVRADLDGSLIFIGKDDFFTEIEGPTLPAAVRGQIDALEEKGRTTMIVRHGVRYLGVLGLMDTPRLAAKPVIARLRTIGIRRMIMISGDNQQVAESVARDVGLDEAWGDLMPDDKVAAVKRLRAEGPVAMVGDGVNDAPAMANATVGIAMGAAGSDVALEAADVALMADDLNRLPFAVGLSRATSRAIRQNLWMSLGIVALLVPATIGGLGIGAAVAAHEGSTLLVVLNALRLLAFEDAGTPTPLRSAMD